MLIVTTKGVPRFLLIEHWGKQFPQLANYPRILGAVFVMTDSLAQTINKNPRLIAFLDGPLMTQESWEEKILQRLGITEIRFFERQERISGPREVDIRHRAYRAYCFNRSELRELDWFQSEVSPRILKPQLQDLYPLLEGLGVAIRNYQIEQKEQETERWIVDHSTGKGKTEKDRVERETEELIAKPLELEIVQKIASPTYPTPEQPDRHLWIEQVKILWGLGKERPLVITPATLGRYTITVGIAAIQKILPPDLEKLWHPSVDKVFAETELPEVEGSFDSLIERF